VNLEAIRAQFPVTRQYIHLNHAAVTNIPLAAVEAVRRVAEDYAHHGMLHQHDRWYPMQEETRALLARLVGASEGEIAFVRNTSHGLSIFASGLDWREGDNVVVPACEYPANVYPWQNLARLGVDTRLVPQRPDFRVPKEDLIAACDAHTRVLAISFVQFHSGYRSDLAALGDFCQQRGIYFVVDAIQGVGALRFDVEEMRVSFASADGHKWLLGPNGIGFLYCRSAILERVHPVVVGWNSVSNAGDFFNLDFTLAPSARRFEEGSSNMLGEAALNASLKLLLAVGIEAVEERIYALTQRAVEGLARRGYSVLSPRGPGEWSGIVTFRPEGGELEPISARLRQARVICSLRGPGIRWSPHFYNTEEEIDAALEALP